MRNIFGRGPSPLCRPLLVALTVALCSVAGTIARADDPPPIVSGGDLARPTGLTRGATVEDCTSHMSLDSQVSLCNSAVAKKLILTWNYDQSACTNKPCAAPDGFNIVRSSHGSPYAIAKVQSLEPGQTAVVFDEPREDAIGACFKVLAYRGTTDFGPPSSAFCTVVSDVTRAPVEAYQTSANANQKTDFIISCPGSGENQQGQTLKANGAQSQLILVGFASYHNKCSQTDTVHQGGLRFDLSNLPPETIDKAILEMHVAGAAVNPSGNGEQRSYTSCAVSYGYPKNWTRGNPLPEYISFDQVGTLSRSENTVSVDLTSMVLNWLKPGGVNNGVVFTGQGSPPEGPHGTGMFSGIFLGNGKPNGECLSVYRDAVLKITFKT